MTARAAPTERTVHIPKQALLAKKIESRILQYVRTKKTEAVVAATVYQSKQQKIAQSSEEKFGRMNQTSK